MDFMLPEELHMLRETVARVSKEELIRLAKDVVRRGAERGLIDAPRIAPDDERELAGVSHRREAERDSPWIHRARSAAQPVPTP